MITFEHLFSTFLRLFAAGLLTSVNRPFWSMVTGAKCSPKWSNHSNQTECQKHVTTFTNYSELCIAAKGLSLACQSVTLLKQVLNLAAYIPLQKKIILEAYRMGMGMEHKLGRYCN